MCRIKRVWWTAIILLTALIFPADLLAAPRVDPHIYRIIQGNAFFNFSKSWSTANGETYGKSSNFSQRYTLATLGNILSHRLFIYDSGFNLTKNKSINEDSNSRNTNSNFFLDTGILPISAVPLHTFYNSSTARSNGGNKSINKYYGLNWHLRIGKFPDTNLGARRSVSKQKGVPTSFSEGFDIAMSKDLGPTKNTLDYRLDRSGTEGSDSDNSRWVINFTNTTNVSRSSSFRLSGTRNVRNDPTSKSTGNALSASFDSHPGPHFRQSHSYDFFNSKSDTSRSQGSSYGGSMSYMVSRNMTSSLRLGSNKNTTTSDSYKSTLTGLSSYGTIGYRITPRLNVSESINYYSSKSDVEGTKPKLSDSTAMTISSSASYSRPLSFAKFSGGYSMGYSQSETSNISTGKAINQGAYFRLAGMKIKKYATLSTSAGFRTSKAFKGDISSSGRNYAANANNIIWKKYVRLALTYRRTESRSNISETDNGDETYNLSADSNYFKSVPMHLQMGRNKYFDRISGVSTSDSLNANISHSRELLDGNLSASFTFNWSHGYGRGQNVITANARYNLNYARTLLDRVRWSFSLSRQEDIDSYKSSTSTSIQNSLGFPIRSWSFSVSHSYGLKESYGNTSTSNTISISLARGFTRVL